MSLDVDNLEIVYKKYYSISLQIKELIERELYNELPAFISKKELIFQEAQNIANRIKANEEDASKLTEICKLIQKQEKENIDNLTKIRNILKEKVTETNKSTKLRKAYSQVESKQGSILDFRE